MNNLLSLSKRATVVSSKIKTKGIGGKKRDFDAEYVIENISAKNKILLGMDSIISFIEIF